LLWTVEFFFYISANASLPLSLHRTPQKSQGINIYINK
jgi:hypothetical protein